MREAISEFIAIANSGKFTAYSGGVPIALPTGETVQVKIQSTKKFTRPQGFRYSKYSFGTEVTAGPHRGLGFGEAPTRILALQKSIAEGVERAIFKALQGTPYGTRNINGWSAHLSTAKASKAALEELLERDAVLVHWLSKSPMKEIVLQSWPNWLKVWTQTELTLSPRFNRLRVLVSDRGYLPTVTTAIIDGNGYVILSHATANSLDQAIQKALAETCRIGQIVTEKEHSELSALLSENSQDAPFSPGDHFRVYAQHMQLPNWIFGAEINWKMATNLWKGFRNRLNPSALHSKFHQITQAPLMVGYCTSDQVQGLFFGRTQKAQAQGWINVQRLKGLGHEGEVNLLPHWVP